MPKIVASMVAEYVVVAPGTGTLTLAGAIAGFRSFSAAVGNANTCTAIIRDATQFEVFEGTLTAGNQLSRDTVLENHLGSTARVNFAGACTVELIAGGTRLLVLDAGVTPSGSALVTQIGRDIVTAPDAPGVRALLGTGQWKDPVVVASTANVNAAAPGATIDGIALTVGDRVLLKDQTTAAQNGIWVFQGSAAAMTRAGDADAWAELPGAVVVVQRGTVNADRLYLCTSDPGGTLGTTAVTWAQVGASGITADANGALATGGATPATGYTSAGDLTLPAARAIRARNSAKAWCNFNGTGVVSIRDAFNVSSITDNGTGDYTVNFTNAMADANYAVAASCKQNNSNFAESPVVGWHTATTSSVRLFTAAAGVSAQDMTNIAAAIFGA